jgi:diacylglycerol kinase family enzyme
MGTENLLAKYLGQEADIETLVTTINEGHWVSLDVGRANGVCFLVMASCGFDAEVVRRLHSTRSGNIRHWSYAGPIFETISRYRFPKIHITIDDALEPEIHSKWAFVFNAPRYAMNLSFAEDASTTDGELDLVTFRGGNLFRGLFYLAGVFMRRHRGWKDCRFQRAVKLRLEAEGEVPFQLDGDPGGFLPLEIEVDPGFMRVMVPRRWVEENGVEADDLGTG